MAHTQDDREASEALVKTFAEQLKIAAAEKKELKEELAALENTVCELEDRLDEALKLGCIAGGVPLGMGCARMPHFTSKK